MTARLIFLQPPFVPLRSFFGTLSWVANWRSDPSPCGVHQ